MVLGITFKENCPDFRNTKVIDLINELNDSLNKLINVCKLYKTETMFKKKNDFFTRRLASFYKHIVFFPNLSDPPPYLWNHFGKVPLFLGKREKNVIVSPTSCYSQEKS